MVHDATLFLGIFACADGGRPCQLLRIPPRGYVAVLMVVYDCVHERAGYCNLPLVGIRHRSSRWYTMASCIARRRCIFPGRNNGAAQAATLSLARHGMVNYRCGRRAEPRDLACPERRRLLTIEVPMVPLMR
jgi:hypothetical protein